MFKLPDYQVVIHIKVNEFSKSLESEIAKISNDYELEESSDYDGMRDYHWSFKTWDDALTAGESFKMLMHNPNLLLLKVKATYDESKKAAIYKDLIRPDKKFNV